MAGPRTYPDLRYLFMRGLIQHESWQRTRHYLKSAADCTSKAIVSLEMVDHPIRSVRQAEKLEGIGGETVKRLRKFCEEKRFSGKSPSNGKFVSSAGAILVALLKCTEEAISQGHSQDRNVHIPQDILRSRARELSEETLLDDDSIGFCQAWWRIQILIKRDYIKKRSLHKSPVYHLLPLGLDTAIRIRGQVSIPHTLIVEKPNHGSSKKRKQTSSSSSPSSSSVSASSSSSSSSMSASITSSSSSVLKVQPVMNRNVQQKRTSVTVGVTDNALYSNDKGNDGVIMLVDISELGGDRVRLGDICEQLERAHITYRTKRLPTGDYGWLWRCDGEERPLPCLVERKRADDLAGTLKDGRFWSQVEKMVKWKKDFENRGISCELHYIVEGDPEQYVVKCADGCQGVGMCGNPSLSEVKRAYNDLESHRDLNIQTTDGIQSTLIILESITADLQLRIKRGDFDLMVALELESANQSELKNETILKVESINEKDAVQQSDLGLEQQLNGLEQQAGFSDIKANYRNREPPSDLFSDRDVVRCHTILPGMDDRKIDLQHFGSPQDRLKSDVLSTAAPSSTASFKVHMHSDDLLPIGPCNNYPNLQGNIGDNVDISCNKFSKALPGLDGHQLPNSIGSSTGVLPDIDDQYHCAPGETLFRILPDMNDEDTANLLDTSSEIPSDWSDLHHTTSHKTSSRVLPDLDVPCDVNYCSTIVDCDKPLDDPVDLCDSDITVSCDQPSQRKKSRTSDASNESEIEISDSDDLHPAVFSDGHLPTNDSFNAFTCSTDEPKSSKIMSDRCRLRFSSGFESNSSVSECSALTSENCVDYDTCNVLYTPNCCHDNHQEGISDTHKTHVVPTKRKSSGKVYLMKCKLVKKDGE